MSGQRLDLDLRNPVQAHADLARLWAWAKPLLVAGHWLVLSVRLATRSDAQNRLLHSRIRDVARHLREWRGVPMDDDDWKRREDWDRDSFWWAVLVGRYPPKE